MSVKKAFLNFSESYFALVYISLIRYEEVCGGRRMIITSSHRLNEISDE